MATLPAPHTWTAGDDATSGNLQTLTDALNFMLSPPAVRVYTSVATSIATGGSGTLVPFASETFDTDAMHSTTVNTDRLTINTAGTYLVTAQLEFASNATGIRSARIFRNGLLVRYINSAAASGSTSGSIIQDEIQCAAGDYLQCYGYQTSGGALALSGVASANLFSARWVSL